MDLLQKKIRESLSKKKLNKQSVGGMSLKLLHKFFDNKNYEINGYLKNGILFVRPNPLFLKNEIYLKKSEILKYINDKLNNFGYEIVIKDIIIKS